MFGILSESSASVKNTETYVNIGPTLSRSTSGEFTVKVAEKLEKIKELVEVELELDDQRDSLIFLGKRK